MKTRALLLRTTLPPEMNMPPTPDSRTDDRIAISRKHLGRAPFVLCYPGTKDAATYDTVDVEDGPES